MQSRKEKRDKGWMDYLQIKKEADKEGSGANGATSDRQRTQKVQGICSWLRQMHGRVLTFAHQASAEIGGRETEGGRNWRDGQTKGGRRENGSSGIEFTLHWLQRGAAAEEHLCEGGISFKTAAFLKHTHTLNPPQSSSPSYPLDLKIAAALSARRGSAVLNQSACSVKGSGAPHPFICLSVCVSTEGNPSWSVTELALRVTSVSRNGVQICLNSGTREE